MKLGILNSVTRLLDCLQYLAIHNNNNLPNKIENTSFGSKFDQILNGTIKNAQRILKFGPSGKISPNLVTVVLKPPSLNTKQANVAEFIKT